MGAERPARRKNPRRNSRIPRPVPPPGTDIKVKPPRGRYAAGQMNQQFGPLLYTITIWALPAIIAITFHEAAHGIGRVSLRRSHRFAPRPRNLQSAKAHRPDGDYFSRGVAASPTFVAFVRLAYGLGAAQPLGRKLIVGVELRAPDHAAWTRGKCNRRSHKRAV
jgi:hypothetical protein